MEEFLRSECAALLQQVTPHSTLIIKPPCAAGTAARRVQRGMVRVRDANGAEAPLLQDEGKHALLPDDANHPFWVGPALSVYQNAGGPNTNWSEYETHRNHLGQPVIEART